MDLSNTDPSTLAHDDRARLVIGAVCLVCSIASVVVVLRFYTRSIILKQVGADDYLVLMALMFVIATGTSVCMNTRNGLGKHLWDLGGPEQIKKYLKGFYISIMLYNIALMFVKLTFLVQYYRVLAVKRMRTIFLIAMVVIGCWSLSQVLISIFICDPISGFWDRSLGAKCVISNLLQWYINSAMNIATDIVIFVLPMPVLSHLNLPRVQKFVLIGIFSLGFFTCAISVIRVKYLKQGGDYSYENVEASAWSMTELCSGVICACLPTLRPIVSKWVPSLSNRLHKANRGYKRHSGGSQATHFDRASKHTRGNSDLSCNIKPGGKEELYYPGRFGICHGDNADGPGGILRGHEPKMPRPPSYARIASHVPYRSAKDYDWLKSSVTTEIGADKNPQPDFDRNHSSTTIQAQS
ncbi:hypothetical protein F4779DRAFT_618487 [Xylariaceae sp. FL0662B]|nr:hypothetical protein F4779DRAFT_618487 [Xylariaceae sp. FL0662B]